MSRPEAWWRADGSEMDEIERSTDGYCVSWNEDKSFELLKMLPKISTEHLKNLVKNIRCMPNVEKTHNHTFENTMSL